MTIRLFDVQTGFGGIGSGKENPIALDELLDEMNHVEITGSLVRTVPDETERDVPASNERLFEAGRAHKRLVPCPVVVPSTAGDYPPEEEQVERAIAAGAGAAWVRVAKDFWLLSDWVSRPLFRALEARRLPAFCLERDIKQDALGELAAKYPALPFLFAGLDYREQRTLLPLLRTFPNVHLAIGTNLTVHRGIEQFVQEAGSDRLLFGSGFPDVDAMPAAAMLLYADIPDADRAKIGADNFDRLMEGIVR